MSVWRMEDVLELYDQPYDEQHPVVCVDERPCQLLEGVLEDMGGDNLCQPPYHDPNHCKINPCL